MRTSLNGKLGGGVVAAVAVVVLFSACAKSSTTLAGGPSPASGGGGGGTAVTVSATTVPGVGKVLVTSQGMTLYYLKTETNGSIKCTGSCASAWPPLLLPSGTASASAGAGVTGKLGTIARPEGTTQVTYNGMPLYTFTSDSPGAASGQGVSNFYAVTASGSGGPAPSATASGSGHYGY